MRAPTLYTRQQNMMETAMTPMIDVVFLLLVFFLWTASFQIAEDLLPSRLSSASGSQPVDIDIPPPPEADFDDLVVRLLPTPAGVGFVVNDTQLASLEELRQKLTTIAEIKADAPVIVHPDPSVELGHVIDVYDIARQVGFEKVQFAVAKKN